MSLRLLFRQFSAVSAAHLINGLLGVAFVPFAVSRLGRAGYGLFAIYLIVQSWVVLAELGVGKDLLRRLASSRDATARAFAIQSGRDAYVVIALLLGVLAPVLMLTVPRWILPVAPANVGAVQVMVLLAVLEYVAAVPIYLRQNVCLADQRFSDYARFVISSGLLRYGLLFGALVVTTRPELVVLAAVARRPVEIWLSGRVLGSASLPAPWARPAFAGTASLLTRSAVLSGAQVLQTGVVSLGGVLVNAFYGIATLGSFRAAFDLASKVWFFSNTAGLVAFPRFARAVGEGGGRLSQPLVRGLLVSRALYGLIAVAGAVAAPLVLPAVGLSESVTVGLFGLLLGGAVCNAHANVPYELVQAFGAYRRAVALSGLALALLVAGFFLLRGRLGPLAIGWAWLASQIVYSMVCDVAALSLTASRGVSRTSLAAATLGLIVPLLVANTVPPSSEGWPVGAAVAVVLSVASAGATLAFVLRQGRSAVVGGS